MDSPFKFLTNRKIIDILIGDTVWGQDDTIRIAMPYLSGPDICELSTYFGHPQGYSWKGGARSRWEYFTGLLQYCIENNKISSLLSYMFAKQQFQNINIPSHYSKTDVDELHKNIVEIALKNINSILSFGGHELSNSSGKFVMRSISSGAVIDTPELKTIDSEYIKDISARAREDIDKGAYDSALTKLKTMVEEIFVYILELNGETHSGNEDIVSLHGKIKKLCNMHQNKDVDKRINDLLSGLGKIITSIAEMRNLSSDSHAKGTKRINISEHHARLYLNAAVMISDFFLSVAQNQIKNTGERKP